MITLVFISLDFAARETTRNMAVSNTRFPTSALFKRRHIIIFLRIMFGFPLKRSDSQYQRFEFNPWLEGGRYVLYLSIPIAGGIYLVYLNMKFHNTNNLLKIMEINKNELGLSNMDMLVYQTLPILNYISNSFYLRSIKKSVTGINKISHKLSKINEDLYRITKGPYLSSVISNDNNSTYRYYKHSTILVVIVVFAAAMMTASWSIFFINSVDIEKFKIYEIVGLVMAALFSSLTYTYPPMAGSADLLVIAMVLETKETFDKFNFIIRNTRKKIGQKECLKTTTSNRCDSLR